MFRFCFLLLMALPAHADVTGAVRVVDGDTLKVGSQTVRLHGIDAPEVKQTCTDPDGNVWTCGKRVRELAAARYHRQIANCKQVDTDRYGRMVATCKVGGEDIGQWLVQQGLAFAYRKYSMAYDWDEKQAAITNRGLHGHTVQSPASFRSSNRAVQVPQVSQNECNLKGNVSAKGRKIFHSPGQADYDRTRINTGKGERWFCTAAEAEAAGWRAAKR